MLTHFREQYLKISLLTMAMFWFELWSFSYNRFTIYKQVRSNFHNEISSVISTVMWG